MVDVLHAKRRTFASVSVPAVGDRPLLQVMLLMGVYSTLFAALEPSEITRQWDTLRSCYELLGWVAGTNGAILTSFARPVRQILLVIAMVSLNAPIIQVQSCCAGS